jgi:hypothetical protein
MPLNISLVTSDLNHDHPDWITESLSGDRLISKLLALPCEVLHFDDVTDMWRPKDFTEWRNMLASWPTNRDNVDRFPQMLNILEADPNYWIYISA